MPIHKLKLIDRQEVARGTMVFMFEKPDGLTFTPGQYAGFTLINPTETDDRGMTRRFSLLHTPDEKYISFATRIQSSAYKRELNALAIGSEIKFAGPTGNFVLHDDSSVPAVLIAGGIGVTPFYCMIKHATKHQVSREIILFYGNNTLADTAFMHELLEMQQQNRHFKLVATMAHPNENWHGETGFITHSMIKKYIPEMNIPMYYICGSPAMVTTLQETLAEMGIDEERIKVEDFPGY